ncbi:unnamed protein product [Prorocentrum cordatum]|uniref:Uncharacterized protein n=1 Tax=Prorocentrum cordatum TaxID=2364126 RepID=A0ABN9UY94_9DINO|nr:unnamed protein product [Polarella glacialis]
MQGFFCKGRCERDWCKANDDVCDCHAVLKSRGYQVPLDAPSAFARAGAAGWAASLGWEAASIPGWTPLRGEQLEVRPSSLAGAGRGLFARGALPGGAVLPYAGTLLTFAEVEREGGQEHDPGGARARARRAGHGVLRRRVGAGPG